MMNRGRAAPLNHEAPDTGAAPAADATKEIAG